MGGPVAFNDGTILMLGQETDDTRASAYRIDTDGDAAKIGEFPELTDLAGDGKRLYGQVERHPFAASNDRGQTRQNLTPR